MNIQQAKIDMPNCQFPVLPWQQNGLELIWHIREHLYNGLGLRHIIDWMMFVHFFLRDTAQFNSFYKVLEGTGLYNLAKTITRLCQLYLGLEGDFAWCLDIDANTCNELM